MRYHCISLAALLASGLLANASEIRFDVSSDGSVALDIDDKPAKYDRAHRLSSKPEYTSNKPSHILEDFQVDLGYEIHSGYPSDTGDFLIFKHIPYAEPPVGELRFIEPLSVQKYRVGVNNGSNANICPQVQVGWARTAMKFMQDFNNTAALRANWTKPITVEDYGDMDVPDMPASEDCLTLDVMVPKSVWNNRDSNTFGAAVVVWVHGGGFVYGWKDQFGSPEGLFKAASLDNATNIIYVAMNYRLGAFGWLGGSKFMEQGGVANLGLLDQAFAMRWVMEHIDKFGGSYRRVTMMGQSAGASSILHHIAAGRNDQGIPKPEMLGAIAQSPGFFPQPNGTQDDITYTTFLNLTGAADVDALLTADTKVLQAANAKMTHESPYGYFSFGPTIDGAYVTDLPGKILKENKYPMPAMMIGHMKLDGLLFTPPWVRTTIGLLQYVRNLFPGVPESVTSAIYQKYPVTSLVPQQALMAVGDFLDDIAIQCNSYYLTEASLNSTKNGYPFKFHPVFRYAFNILPAVHGYDTGYTYYPTTPLIPPVNATVAKFFQEAIVNFARYMNPNPEDSDFWPLYTGSSRQVLNIGSPEQLLAPNFTISVGSDIQDRGKCAYWQDSPFYAPTGSSEVESGGERFVVQGGEGLKGELKMV